MLLLILTLLILGDYSSTRYAVKRWGVEVESNELWLAGFRKQSRLMDILYFAVLFVISWITYRLIGSSGLVALCAVLAFVNLNNLVAIARMHKRERE